MGTCRLPIALAASLTLLLAGAPAVAQSAPTGKNALTVYGGYAGGGSFEQTGGSNATVDLASGGAGALSYAQPLAPALALRMEWRGYATLINSDGGFFCSGGCVVALKGEALLQGEALLGLSLRF